MHSILIPTVRFASFLAILIAFGIATIAQAEEMPKATIAKHVTEEEIEFMLHADQVDLYAIPAHPEKPDPSGIQGYPILAHAQIKTEETKKVLISAFRLAVDTGSHSALCFNPHHVIRFSKGCESHTFIVCFECGQAGELIRRDGAPDACFVYIVCMGSGEAFNAILDASDPEFRSKALFIGSCATADIEVGEEISLMNADTAQEWRDKLSGREIGVLDYDRLPHPRALKRIERGTFFSTVNTSLQKP